MYKLRPPGLLTRFMNLARYGLSDLAAGYACHKAFGHLAHKPFSHYSDALRFKRHVADYGLFTAGPSQDLLLDYPEMVERYKEARHLVKQLRPMVQRHSAHSRFPYARLSHEVFYTMSIERNELGRALSPFKLMEKLDTASAPLDNAKTGDPMLALAQQAILKASRRHHQPPSRR